MQASPGPSPWPSEDNGTPATPPNDSRSSKGTPKGSPKGTPKASRIPSVANLRDKSPRSQSRAPQSESKRLTLPRSDSKLDSRVNAQELRGKSPRAEKTLLEVELRLSKGDPRSQNKLLPGIDRKPSRESSNELTVGSLGSRPQSRAGSKQSSSLEEKLIFSARRTPSKSIAEQSVGELPKFKAKDKKACGVAWGRRFALTLEFAVTGDDEHQRF